MKTVKSSSEVIVLKPENFYDLSFIGNIVVAGKRILFEVAKPDRVSNDYSTCIYQLIDGKAVRFTRGERDYGMVKNRTGKLIAYESKEGGKVSINIRDISSSSDYRLIEIEGRIGKIVWDKDSEGVYIIAQKESKSEEYRVIENIPIFSDDKGFMEGFSYELLYVDRKGKSSVILRGKEEIRDFAVNPMKKEIAIEVRPLDSDDYHARIGILSPVNGHITYLKSANGEYLTPGGIGGTSSMEYLDDGTLVFLLNKHEHFIEEAPEIVFWKDGRLNEVMKKYDISPGSALSMDSSMVDSTKMRIRGDQVYFIATVHGKVGLYSVNASGEMKTVVAGEFSVESFDFDGNVVYFVAQNSNTPPEIYTFDRKVNRLFTMNNHLEKWKLKKPENFHFRASDGKDIEAWILKGNGKGTIVRIHGGPRGAFGEALVFEAHLLNSMGFSVIYCNPRGSDSYGDDFAAAVVKRYGERDFMDIMEMVEYSIKKYSLDPTNFGVTGGSYGGFMVNWIVGHTDKFKAAVSDRSFADAVSDYFSGDIGPTFDSDQIGGTPYDNLDTYWEKSPIKHIRNCKTPILLIQNDADYRCPVWQAYELFTQLKMQGTTTKLVIFRSENHNLPYSGKPRNRVKRLEEIAGWFEKYLI
ncbi:MAG: prolyl oligopeptidase family serine peptidase [Thermoplasmata archaeon]